MKYFKPPYINPILLNIGVTVFFTILTVLGAKIRLQIWEIPFTLQTIGVYGSGLFLGWRRGCLSQLLYLGLGLFFPVFAAEGFGITYLATQNTSGYLLSFPVVSAVIGILSEKRNTFTGKLVSLQAGSLLLFFSGVIWLHFAVGHSSWLYSIYNGWIKFIPADLLKIIILTIIYSGIKYQRFDAKNKI